MRDALGKLIVDFLSTIAFLFIYGLSGNVVAATLAAIAIAIGQFIHAHISGKPLSLMTGASLALAIVLGGATLLTHDPRFVLIKPSIAHFAIGAIMLERGWMLRYLPPIVANTIPRAVTVAGYAWAGLLFAIGAGVIAVAMTGDVWLWGLYVGVVSIGAKIVAFLAQYVIFRALVRRALRRDPALAASLGLTSPAQAGT